LLIGATGSDNSSGPGLSSAASPGKIATCRSRAKLKDPSSGSRKATSQYGEGNLKMAVLGENGNLVLCRLLTVLGFHRLAKAKMLTIHVENEEVGHAVHNRCAGSDSIDCVDHFRRFEKDDYTGRLFRDGKAAISSKVADVLV